MNKKLLFACLSAMQILGLSVQGFGAEGSLEREKAESGIRFNETAGMGAGVSSFARPQTVKQQVPPTSDVPVRPVISDYSHEEKETQPVRFRDYYGQYHSCNDRYYSELPEHHLRSLAFIFPQYLEARLRVKPDANIQAFVDAADAFYRERTRGRYFALRDAYNKTSGIRGDMATSGNFQTRDDIFREISCFLEKLPDVPPPAAVTAETDGGRCGPAYGKEGYECQAEKNQRLLDILFWTSAGSIALGVGTLLLAALVPIDSGVVLGGGWAALITGLVLFLTSASSS